MATQPKSRNRQPGSGSRSNGRSASRSNGHSASQKGEKYRFAQNVGEERTVAEREYLRYALSEPDETGGDPDVLLDVPVVKVDSIHLELEDLDAHVALKAQVLDLVTLNVGVDVHLGRVCVDVKGVEAQALLKVRLDHVAAIVDRVLTTIDRNPELLKSLGRAIEDVGAGASETLDGAGEAVENVGEGAEGAVRDVGSGAGDAAGELGKGAGQAVGDVGEGAGQALDEVGQGAGQAAGGVGQGVGNAVGNLDQVVGGAGQALGGVGEAAGQTVGGLGQAAGGAGDAVGGAGQAVGQAAGGVTGALGGGQGNGGGGHSGGAGDVPDAARGGVAKQAAKVVAKEIASAASDEAKDLGLAATRKVKDLGERRRQRRAEKHNATRAAFQAAEELGVNLDEVEGTGADGRITVRDVRDAG